MEHQAQQHSVGKADLHTHTVHSDGTDSVAQLLQGAVAAGLDTIALTDHDGAAGWDEAARLVPPGLTVIPGVEFSTKLTPDDHRPVSVHVLGYLFDRTDPAIISEWARIKTERQGRGAAIVAKLVAAGYPITLTRVQEIAGPASISRPHIARALVEAGVINDVSAAFTELLVDGSAYDVPLRATSVSEAVQMITAAGGVAVIAHPRDRSAAAHLTADVIESLIPLGLAGLEVDHYAHDDGARAELRSIADELGLLATGSSDYHGDNKPIPLGNDRTAPEVVERIVAAGRLAPFT